jgi:hypothetical protein
MLVHLARHGSEVTADQQEILGIFGAAQERNDGILPIVKVHPFEAGIVEVHLI